MVVASRRRGLHARLVEAIEVLAPDHEIAGASEAQGLPAGRQALHQVERLAHHALRGEVWDKAVTYCQQAGARAYDRAAFREAAAAFELALETLMHLPEDSDTRALAIDLRLALDGSLNALGEYGRCLALLGEAEALARALDDRDRLGGVLARMAHVIRLTGDTNGAITAGRQALALAAELGESALQMQASLNLAQAYRVLGDFGQAAALLQRNVETADRASRTPCTDVRIQSRAWLAWTLSDLGAFAEGRRHGEEALRLTMLESRGDTPILVHGCLGRSYLIQGDLDHAIQVLDQGLALCRTADNRTNLRPIATSLGYAAALQVRRQRPLDTARDLQPQRARCAWRAPQLTPFAPRRIPTSRDSRQAPCVSHRVQPPCARTPRCADHSRLPRHKPPVHRGPVANCR